MTKDLNDRLREGTLPDDPFEGTVISEEVPHIVTDRGLISHAAQRARTRRTYDYGTCGHWELDRITGGLRPGDVWLIGAETSYGKSSWAIMIYDENRKRGKNVLIVSAEDSERTYGDRLLCRRSRVPAQALRDRQLSPEHHQWIAEAEMRAELKPAFIDARGKPVEWLAPQVKHAAREHKIEVVIFDYVGAFANKIQQQDKRNAITYIGRVLTDVAKTCIPGGICGIIMSQLTSEKESEMPNRYSIRDSKDLTQMSEVTLLGAIAPKELLSPDGHLIAQKGERVVSIAKCKQGAIGAIVRMEWNTEVACFDAIERFEQTQLPERYP